MNAFPFGWNGGYSDPVGINPAEGRPLAFKKHVLTIPSLLVCPHLLPQLQQGTDNLFISECKIWHGEQKLYEAVNQLFTRYLTWHDTDAALIIFVESGDFTKTIVKVRTALSTHPLFKCSQKAHIEKKNVFSCALHHSDDNDRLINLEVMLFHFPKRVSKAKPTNKRK